MNQTELLYFGKPVKVLAGDKTHYLIQLENGIKICTNKNTFKK